MLILDEPTASLDRHEVEILFAVMRELAARGIGIVFVTHFLDQVYEISDRITVLRNGRLVGERETAALPRHRTDPHDARPRTGRDRPARAQRRRSRQAREICARFEDYGKAGYVAPFDLELRHGEVVGLAGLLGSGRTETARLVFGAERADSGSVDGRRRAGPAAVAARRRRATASAIAPRSARPTASSPISPCARTSCWRCRPSAACIGRCRAREQDEIATRFIKLLDIRPPEPERPIGLLSGGNQQKVLLARWLATAPRLLVLDEPTRGIDVGAHAEIIRLIRELCDDGLALLVISSELDEIVTYSDRVDRAARSRPCRGAGGRRHRRRQHSRGDRRRCTREPAQEAAEHDCCSSAAPRPCPDHRA